MKTLRNTILGIALSLFVTSANATDFLWDPGTSNNGQIVAAFTIMDGTTSNALAAAAVASSATVCTSGVCSNATTGQGIWGIVSFTSGTFQAACTAGANIAGWFLQTLDGSTFESTAAAPARAPDFIVPLPTGTTAGTFQSGLSRIPALKFKVLIQNNCTASGGGGTFSASTANVLTLGVQAVKY